jgi:hypothetical protein
MDSECRNISVGSPYDVSKRIPRANFFFLMSKCGPWGASNRPLRGLKFEGPQSSDFDTRFGRFGASFWSCEDLILCMGLKLDGFDRNPVSYLKKWLQKGGWMYQKDSLFEGWSRFEVRRGSRFCPIAIKIRANDAAGFKKSTKNFSDLKSKGVATP